MGLLIGLDIGTSTTKALLLDTDKGVIGSVTADYPLYSPHPGWSEQEPEDMWQATVKAVRGLLEKFNVDPEAVKGIGLSGQMHSSVFLDSSFNVIRPAILWNDTRTSAQCRYIIENVDPDLLVSEVCNPVLEGFTLPKVLWLRDNEPENFQKLRHLVLPKDYVRFRLTGNLHMEVSDAAGIGVGVGGALAGEIGQEEQPLGTRLRLFSEFSHDVISILLPPQLVPEPAQGETGCQHNSHHVKLVGNTAVEHMDCTAGNQFRLLKMGQQHSA